MRRCDPIRGRKGGDRGKEEEMTTPLGAMLVLCIGDGLVRMRGQHVTVL
jgi:hypothetical protein